MKSTPKILKLMDMANAKIVRLGPNSTYIPLTCVPGFCDGGNANFKIRVGDKANFSVFRYQHVGIPNAKFRVGGSKPTPGPNVNVFASQ